MGVKARWGRSWGGLVQRGESVDIVVVPLQIFLPQRHDENNFFEDSFSS